MAADTAAVGKADERTQQLETEGELEFLAISEQQTGKPSRGRNAKPEHQRTASDGSGAETPPSARSAGAKKAAATKAAKRKAAEQAAAELSTLLVEMVNLAAVSALGQDAAMNDLERGMVEPGLANILNRTSDAAIARFVGWADLLMVGAGTGLWLLRLRAQQATNAPAAEESGQLPLPGITVSEEGASADSLWSTRVGAL